MGGPKYVEPTTEIEQEITPEVSTEGIQEGTIFPTEDDQPLTGEENFHGE